MVVLVPLSCASSSAPIKSAFIGGEYFSLAAPSFSILAVKRTRIGEGAAKEKYSPPMKADLIGADDDAQLKAALDHLERSLRKIQSEKKG